MIVPQYVAVQQASGVARSPRLAAVLQRLQEDYGMTVAHQDAHQVILVRRGTPIVPLPAQRGVVVGHLFDRAAGTRIVDPAPGLGLGVEAFIRDFWGGYIAFRSDPAGAEAWRDPSGAVACYYAWLDNAQILTSAPAILFQLGLLQADVDALILRQSLVYRDIKPARTILRDIFELLPGVASRAGLHEPATRCIWSPWAFIASPGGMTFEDAVSALAASVTTSARAWATCFERPMLEISGGLDSAIVAAIVSAHAASDAVTFAPIAGDPDETPYAVSVADALGIPLAIIQPEIDAIEVTRSNAAGLARPYARCFAQNFDSQALAHATRTAADGIFSGGGGDNVFCYLQSLSPLLDRLYAAGPGRGAIETLGDLAALGNTNVWAVAVRTLRRLMRPAKAPWHVDTRLLAREGQASFPVGHPWTDIPSSAPPGKVSHVAALIAFQNHLEGHSRSAHAPIISPLLSQPIMETCLGIPSWLWCRGGINRAPARAAFAGGLPVPVLARRSKGAFDSLAAHLLERNRLRIRDLLLGGVLAAEQVMDPAAVLRALDTTDPGLTVRLLHLVDTEAWARSWGFTAVGAPRA